MQYQKHPQTCTYIYLYIYIDIFYNNNKNNNGNGNMVERGKKQLHENEARKK